MGLCRLCPSPRLPPVRSRRTLWVLGVRFRFFIQPNRMRAPGLLFKPFRTARDDHGHQPHNRGAKSTFKAQMRLVAGAATKVPRRSLLVLTETGTDLACQKA